MRLRIFIWLGGVALSLALLLAWGADGDNDEPSARRLILGHNLDRKHPVHRGLAAFSRKAAELSQGRLDIRLYPDGQLGPERDLLELVQLGAVAFTKVSSTNLERFAPRFAVFNLPYVFADREHFFRVLDGRVGAEMLASPVDRKLRGLAYYDSGARSIYARRAVTEPEDLAGLKIRVMASGTAIRMIRAFGGAPTPMPFGEIYTALQQGIIDGAESNITAMTLGKHGEVIKHFSLTEHTMLPDVLIVGEPTWRRLSKAERGWLRAAAQYSSQVQRELWAAEIRRSEREARAMGVRVNRVNRERFVARAEKVHAALVRDRPELGELIARIRGVRKK